MLVQCECGKSHTVDNTGPSYILGYEVSVCPDCMGTHDRPFIETPIYRHTLKRDDLLVESFRNGPNVNQGDSGIRVRHLPTYLVAESTRFRLREQNKVHAIEVLRLKYNQYMERTTSFSDIKKALMVIGPFEGRLTRPEKDAVRTHLRLAKKRPGYLDSKLKIMNDEKEF